MELKIYCVKMQKGYKTWLVNTQANSEFNAMYQMSKKYAGAKAVEAKVVQDCEWSVDV